MATAARRRLPDPELARVLADPTRRRILDLVVASPEPVTVAALTDAIGCNHNAVRQHLDRLRAAGLVIESREERHAPGRPRLLYRAALPVALDARHPYERLARLLLRAMSTAATPRDIGRDAGREDASAYRGADAIDALQAETARQGFAPTRVSAGRRVELVLGRCPVADVAADDPASVCALHRGVAEGFVDAIGGARVVGLTARAPHSAGCRIRLVADG